MKRSQAFLNLVEHPMYSKHFKKLNKTEVDFCLSWINAREHLDFNEYSKQANRLFLDGKDKGIVRPKLENICQELISISKS